MIANLPHGTFTKLKAIYPLLLAGFALSSAFFTYCILFIPTGASFKDPLAMIYGALWVLVMVVSHRKWIKLRNSLYK